MATDRISQTLRNVFRRVMANAPAYEELMRSLSLTVGDKNGSTVKATEMSIGGLHHTRLTLTSHVTALADNAGVVAYGGSKIYDFPAGGILVLGALANLAVTKSSTGVNADWDGDFSLGTATAGNTALLVGTQQNILPSTSTPQASSGATTAKGLSITAGGGFTQRLSLQDFKLPATLLQLAASPGSSILGLTSGTHGSASPILTGNGANNNSKSDSARILFTVPPQYATGSTVTVRVRCKVSAAAATAQTIDVLAFRSDLAAGVSSDLCTTAAQTITTSYANYDFTLTPSAMAAGDVIDLLVTLLANDTSGTGTITGTISNVEVIYGESQLQLGGSRVFDGTSVATDLYLNYKVDDADHDVGGTACNLLSTGTIDLFWTPLGDY